MVKAWLKAFTGPKSAAPFGPLNRLLVAGVRRGFSPFAPPRRLFKPEGSTVKLRRRYSDQQKAEALACLAANAGNVKRTARQLGIPAATLTHWSKGRVPPEVTKDGDQKKQCLAEAMEELAFKLVGLAAKRASRADLKELAVCLGIAIDKMLLLRRQPNQIIATETMTHEQRVVAVQALLARCHASLNGNGEEHS
jgi:transposase-like protein